MLNHNCRSRLKVIAIVLGLGVVPFACSASDRVSEQVGGVASPPMPAPADPGAPSPPSPTENPAPPRPLPDRKLEDAERDATKSAESSTGGEGGTWAGVPGVGAGDAGTRGDRIELPTGYEIVSNVLLPTESYLPKADGMPTGVVLLDARERTKNRRLCDALLGTRTATVRTEAAARRDDPTGDYLVTHWLSLRQVANEGDCAALLAAYDFTRADRIKGAYGLQSARGPVFLALDPSGEMIYLDLTEATPDQVFQATNDWMQRALASPTSGAAQAPRPRGLAASANRLFAKVAGRLGALAAADGAPVSIRFNDPVTGLERRFTVYRAGVYFIGVTFLL